MCLRLGQQKSYVISCTCAVASLQIERQGHVAPLAHNIVNPTLTRPKLVVFQPASLGPSLAQCSVCCTTLILTLTFTFTLNPNHNPNPVPNSNLNANINATITLTEQGQRETGQAAKRQSGSLFNPELNATAGFRCSTLPYRGWRFSRLS